MRPRTYTTQAEIVSRDASSPSLGFDILSSCSPLFPELSCIDHTRPHDSGYQEGNDAKTAKERLEGWSEKCQNMRLQTRTVNRAESTDDPATLDRKWEGFIIRDVGHWRTLYPLPTDMLKRIPKARSALRLNTPTLWTHGGTKASLHSGLKDRYRCADMISCEQRRNERTIVTGNVETALARESRDSFAFTSNGTCGIHLKPSSYLT
jgi:hypothetical protein